MTATKEAILRYLENHPSASANLISRSLGFSAADIRYHLQQLVASGEVESFSIPNHERKPGRPARQFRLAQSELPNNLAGLLASALQILAEQAPADWPERLSRQLLPHLDPALPFRQRLMRLIEFLQSSGYRAHWEAGKDGPMILLRNCPYAAVLPDFPALCRVDQALITAGLGEEVDQVTWITHSPMAQACKFIIARRTDAQPASELQ